MHWTVWRSGEGRRGVVGCIANIHNCQRGKLHLKCSEKKCQSRTAADQKCIQLPQGGKFSNRGGGGDGLSLRASKRGRGSGSDVYRQKDKEPSAIRTHTAAQCLLCALMYAAESLASLLPKCCRVQSPEVSPVVVLVAVKSLSDFD